MQVAAERGGTELVGHPLKELRDLAVKAAPALFLSCWGFAVFAHHKADRSADQIKIAP